MIHKEHRIYQYLSEPITLMGMTIDEFALGIVGLMGCIFPDSLWLKTFCGIAGMGGVFVVKKVKKMISGFSLTSFIHWHFGLMQSRPKSWPPSYKRYYLS